MNYRHIAAVLLRNLYLLRRSHYRAMSLFYWATVELFLWGFVTLWLKDIANPDVRVNLVVMVIGALVFWDLFFRVQQSVTLAFLEDIWSRNMLNIFASPLKARELVLGYILLSLLFGFISFGFVAVLAALLYALEIWTLGFYIIPFAINLLFFGWALGFIILGFTIRYGPSVEILAWSLPVLVQPLSAVFYPVSILPGPLQKVAWFIPTMHLFEGMRAVVLEGRFDLDHVVWASLLTVGYFALGIGFFYWMLSLARQRGLLSRLVTD